MICLQFIVPAAILYPLMDRIKIVGGLQIQVGGDSRGDLTLGLGGDLVGDSVGCFQFGDVDVTIWGGLDGVGDSGLVECQASCKGYGVLTVYHCLLVVRCSTSCHTVP